MSASYFCNLVNVATDRWRGSRLDRYATHPGEKRPFRSGGCRFFVRLARDEFDVEVNTLVGHERPLRLTFADDEYQAVVFEQGEFVVYRPIVALERVGKAEILSAAPSVFTSA